MTAPATPAALFARLAGLGISVATVEHPAAFTVEDLEPHVAHLPGVSVKNLFLCDAKKKMWLVVAPHDRRIDLKKLPGRVIGAALSVVWLGMDRLMRVLGVTPGSVTPFALINDPEQQVQVILDAWMMDQDSHQRPSAGQHYDDHHRAGGADGVSCCALCGHAPRVVNLDR